MIPFLLGLAAGAVIRSDQRLVGRTLAGIAVKAEDAAGFVARRVHRASAQFREDYEDLVAEARAERESHGNQGGF